MKIILILLLFYIAVYSNKVRVSTDLTDYLNSSSQIFIVKLLDFTPLQITKSNRGLNNYNSIRKFAIIATISKIINSGSISTIKSENWSFNYSDENRKLLNKYSIPIKIGDTIVIMNYESIKNSSLDLGDNRILEYHYSDLEAEKPLVMDSAYIFISQWYPSKMNSIFYGNIDFGIYPNNKKMLIEIDRALNRE